MQAKKRAGKSGDIQKNALQPKGAGEHSADELEEKPEHNCFDLKKTDAEHHATARSRLYFYRPTRAQ